jgi:hypothetical protein
MIQTAQQLAPPMEYTVNRHLAACCTVVFWLPGEAEAFAWFRFNVRRRRISVVLDDGRQLSCTQARYFAHEILDQRPCSRRRRRAEALDHIGAIGQAIRHYFVCDEACLESSLEARIARIVEIIANKLGKEQHQHGPVHANRR